MFTSFTAQMDAQKTQITNSALSEKEKVKDVLIDIDNEIITFKTK